MKTDGRPRVAGKTEIFGKALIAGTIKGDEMSLAPEFLGDGHRRFADRLFAVFIGIKEVS